MSDLICGREYKVQEPTIKHAIDKKKAKARFLVDGIFHPGGLLNIRFKSREKAERHIRNIGKDVEFQLRSNAED